MWQRDARICTAKAGFFRSRDNSPSSGHVTRRSLLCHLLCGISKDMPSVYGFIIRYHMENARGKNKQKTCDMFPYRMFF